MNAAAIPAGAGAVPLLELRGITKAFPGTLANDRVSLRVMPGEIHALLGENGAGKSTLVKIIYGVLRADRGEVRWNGAPVAVAGPRAARALGIGMVFQHFSLFEAMTVLENIQLAMPAGTDMQALRARLGAISRDYGLPLQPDRHVHDLSVGERQRIEIVRCLLLNPSLLILDEPTSVLTPQEARRLFETLRQLSREGCALLYISHKLEEVRALCRTATILRGGRVVASCDPRAETARSLAELMIGDRLMPPARDHAPGEGAERLVIDRLDLASERQFGTDLAGIELGVRAGEIVGIAGVAGNGQRELMAALTGEVLLHGRPEAIRIDGVAVGHDGPGRRRELGAAFVPEERIGHAAIPGMSLRENGFLTAYRRLRLARFGLIDRAGSGQYASRIIARFDVRTTGADALADSLSGGNLQKFITGREIAQEPALLVVSQPSWGVDAGAAAAIHRALLDLARRGCAVLVISQDLDEIFAICDRVAVISGGCLSPPRPVGEIGVEEVGLLMAGLPATAGRVGDDPA